MNNIYFFGGGKLMASIIDALNKKEYKKNFKQYVFTSARHSKEEISQKLNLKQYLLRNKIQFEIINKIVNYFFSLKNTTIEKGNRFFNKKS